MEYDDLPESGSSKKHARPLPLLSPLSRTGLRPTWASNDQWPLTRALEPILASRRVAQNVPNATNVTNVTDVTTNVTKTLKTPRIPSAQPSERRVGPEVPQARQWKPSLPTSRVAELRKRHKSPLASTCFDEQDESTPSAASGDHAISLQRLSDNISPLTMNELLYARKSGSPIVFRHEEHWKAVEEYDKDMADLARERHEYCSVVAAQSRVTAVRLREARQRDQKLFELHYHFKDPTFAGSVLPEAAFYTFAEKSDRLHTTPELQDEDRDVYVKMVKDETPYEKQERLRKTKLQAVMRVGEALSAKKTSRKLQDKLKKLSTRAHRMRKVLSKSTSFSVAANEKDDKAKDSKESEASGTRKLGLMVRNVSEVKSVKAQGPGACLYAGSVSFMAGLKEQVVQMSCFSKYNISGTGLLDQAEVMDSLEGLGLTPKNELEREEVSGILLNFEKLQFTLDDYCNEVVPTIRQKVKELRRPNLGKLFKKLDTFERSKLSISEIMKSLLIYGFEVYEEALKAALKGFAQKTGRSEKLLSAGLATLDEDAFAEFVCLQQELAEQERVSRLEDLVSRLALSDEEQELWRHDLVKWHLRFHEYNPSRGYWGSSSGFVQESQVLLLFRDSGLVPKSQAKVVQMRSMLQHHLRPDGTISFPDFLKVVNFLKELEKDKVGKIIDDHTDQNCCIPAREVCTFFRVCGFISKVQAERMEVQELVDQGDGQGSKYLGRAPIIDIWIRLHALLKETAVERERQYVLTNGGWTEYDYIDFKKAFHRFDEDMSDMLERDELVQAMDLLRGNVWRTQSSVNMMLSACGVDSERDVKVNFMSFLRLLKLIDEVETRHNLGITMGYSPERTDRLYSGFQALDQEGHGSVQKATLANAMRKATAKWCSPTQLSEALFPLGSNSAPVNFQGFLKVVKALENVVEGDWEECLDDICAWENSLGLDEEEGNVEEHLEAQTPTSTPSMKLNRMSSAVAGKMSLFT